MNPLASRARAAAAQTEAEAKEALAHVDVPPDDGRPDDDEDLVSKVRDAVIPTVRNADEEAAAMADEPAPTSATIDEPEPTPTQEAPPVFDSSFALVELSRIAPTPDNVREELGDVEGMAESIKRLGVLEPVLLTPLYDGGAYDYQLDAGNRRRAGAELAGLLAIPALIQVEPGDAARRLERMMAENLQRKDLTPIEEARGYRRLMDEAGWTQDEVAVRMQTSPGNVSRKLALLKLPEPAREAVAVGELTMGAAYELSKLPPKKAEAVWKKASDPRLAAAGERLSETVSDYAEVAIRDHEQEKERAAIIRKAKADGLEVLATDTTLVHSGRWADGGPRAISARGYGDLAVSAKEHASEPCHAVIFDFYSRKLKPVCKDPERHKQRGGKSKLKGKLAGMDTGPRAPVKTPEEKAAAERQDKLNALWAQVVPARRGFLATLAAGLDPDEAIELYSIAFVVNATAGGFHRGDAFDEEVICEVLGLEPAEADVKAWAKTSHPDRQRKASPWAVAIAAYLDKGKAAKARIMAIDVGNRLEASIPNELFYWNGRLAAPLGAYPLYFAWLERHGYEVAPIERALLADDPEKALAELELPDAGEPAGQEPGDIPAESGEPEPEEVTA